MAPGDPRVISPPKPKERLASDEPDPAEDVDSLREELAVMSERLAAGAREAALADEKATLEVDRLGRQLKTAERDCRCLEGEVERLLEEREIRREANERARASILSLQRELDALRQASGKGGHWPWRALLARLLKGIRRRTRILPVLEQARRRRQASRLAESGLFDAAYYCQRYSDVARSGTDPLLHYLSHGAGEGRDPHPMFDTSYYVEQHGHLLGKGINPLLHFATSGLASGLPPHPAYTAEQYRMEAERWRENPSTLENEEATTLSLPAPAQEPRKLRPTKFHSRLLSGPTRPRLGAATVRTILVSHVLPHPPRAGNEYRIQRLVQWLESTGHEVHLVICPPPGEPLDPQAVDRAALEFANLTVVQRDGVVLHQSSSSEVSTLLESLSGKRPRAFPEARGLASGRTERVVAMEETFCPDHLVDVVLKLEACLHPRIVIASYVFMSRVLALLGGDILKVIDTHDVFSTKASKVLEFGVKDELALSHREEALLLARADLAIAIQPDEAQELRTLVPDREVVVAGIDFDVTPGSQGAATAPIVLCVGSNNPLNVKGVKDFLALGWPLVRSECPQARLWIAGQVASAIDPAGNGVELLGRVDDLDALYAQARVVVNPAVAGTGLKVKTLEALSRARPIVLWPSGVEGISPELLRFCDVATNWYDFARQVTRRLAGETRAWSSAEIAEITRELSAEVVYRSLGTALRARLDGSMTGGPRSG